jgi:hypothetical protein
MKLTVAVLLLVLGANGCHKLHANRGSLIDSATPKATDGLFSKQELAAFTALGPIDAHAHAYQNAPEFFALFKRLNLHILDIMVTVTPNDTDLMSERNKAWNFVDATDHYVSFCTTFNPFQYNKPRFSSNTISEINRDFDRGAIAVKIWKNIRKEVRTPNGTYILSDNPAFSKIYRDIAARGKTLIAHIADPDEMWEVPDPSSPNYAHYQKNPH